MLTKIRRWERITNCRVLSMLHIKFNKHSICLSLSLSFAFSLASRLFLHTFSSGLLPSFYFFNTNMFGWCFHIDQLQSHIASLLVSISTNISDIKKKCDTDSECCSFMSESPGHFIVDTEWAAAVELRKRKNRTRKVHPLDFNFNNALYLL